MKFIKYAVSLLNKAYQPIKDNASFFFFMYLIGILVSYAAASAPPQAGCTRGGGARASITPLGLAAPRVTGTREPPA